MGKVSSETNEKDLAVLKTRMVQIIETLEKNERSNRQRPDDFLDSAYKLVDGVDNEYAMMAKNAILKTWKEAQFRGLFTEYGHFYPTIKSGTRDRDQDMVFQYIVPVKYVPEFSTLLANVELVLPSQARKSDDPSELSHAAVQKGKHMRDYAKRYSNRPEVDNRPKTKYDTSTRDNDSYLEHWKKLTEANPEMLKQEPNIQVDVVRQKASRTVDSISTVHIKNRNGFATEVTLKYAIVGIQERDYYALVKKEEKIKLLPNAHLKWDVNFNSKNVIYRGFAAIVLFDGKPITTASSDARLNSFTDEEEFKFLRDASKAPKPEKKK
ncbi:hypothetical protein [Persicirhabdus sediminis]|uniref:Uncharacterized protein n=1 Tax=Persicirhabdus sediminis TaxID=454144 RepID=A0A8J7MJE8_9BACT|nr:hypothetical protein [Persicirhabdus sediminis]MBK1792103.1 hypothetical protein [Persicirhabdus sediminis]